VILVPPLQETVILLQETVILLQETVILLQETVILLQAVASAIIVNLRCFRNGCPPRREPTISEEARPMPLALAAKQEQGAGFHMSKLLPMVMVILQS
jgi:hypothetical protein